MNALFVTVGYGLIELLAVSILDGVPATRSSGWRATILRTASAVRSAVASHRNGDRLLLEVPAAVTRSHSYMRVKAQLLDAGLQPAEAAEVARVVMVQAITSNSGGSEPTMPKTGATAKIAIDSGSRGVVLRRGSDMETLIRVPHDPEAAAPAILHGETVKVRRLRGAGRGDIELNPARRWRFQIHGPTWNTVLDLGGLDVREVKLDSGAAKVECNLPRPIGVVPIIVSGGVVGVSLHRPPGVAVVAEVSTGALRLKLDAFSVQAAASDLHWESAGASTSADRYELRISGGAVQVSLDEGATEQPEPRVESPIVSAGPHASALDILLDGVESRVGARP